MTVAVAVTLLLSVSPALADTPRAVGLDRGTVYYLSLGDSLAYGYQQQIYLDQVASGRYDPSAFIGYASLLDHRLSRLVHGPVHEVNYGCPGETTSSFFTGCVFTTADGAPTSWLHDPYTTSQMSAAETFLAAHQHQVAAVTLDLGSNNLRQALFSCLTTQGCDLATYLPGVVNTMLADLATIAARVESADPGVPLVIANIYNPEVVDPALPPSVRAITDSLVATINQAIATLVTSLDTGGLPVTLADAYGAINGGIPGLADTRAVCILTNMCTALHDIHPSTAGYASLSRAFLAGIETMPPV
jgi:lysophospholipase L1-like esterase